MNKHAVKFIIFEKERNVRFRKMPSKKQYIAQVLWDTNLTTEQVMPLLENKVEKVLHLDKSTLFKRCLESYSWFTLLEIFQKEEIIRLLTPEVIASIRSKSLRQKYLFLHEYLQRVI